MTTYVKSKMDKYFNIGSFALGFYVDKKHHVYGINLSFPFITKYGIDQYNYSWHWCRKHRDEEGYCCHYPANYKGGIMRDEIMKAYKEGGEKLIDIQFK